LIGPVTDDGPWYFALNNRRLWVLKRCREQGLLSDNQILVRVRAPKSQAERERYTLDKCVVEAKIMRVAAAAGSDKTRSKNLDLGHELVESSCVGVDNGKEAPTLDRKDRGDDELDSDRHTDKGDDDDDDDSEDGNSSFNRVRVDNPFAALS
jgi:hypothetical protein